MLLSQHAQRLQKSRPGDHKRNGRNCSHSAFSLSLILIGNGTARYNTSVWFHTCMHVFLLVPCLWQVIVYAVANMSYLEYRDFHSHDLFITSLPFWQEWMETIFFCLHIFCVSYSMNYFVFLLYSGALFRVVFVNVFCNEKMQLWHFNRISKHFNCILPYLIVAEWVKCYWLCTHYFLEQTSHTLSD